MCMEQSVHWRFYQNKARHKLLLIESLKQPIDWVSTYRAVCHLNLLAHNLCYGHTINSMRTLFGDFASSSDHVVIYGINVCYDHELKM